MTAALGWAAAAATARIRLSPDISGVPVPFTAAGNAGGEGPDPAAAPEIAVPHEPGRAARVRGRRQTAYLVLLCAVAVACLPLAALAASRG